MKKARFIGLDVHADTIAVAVAEAAHLRVCYEAGPTGYVIWQVQFEQPAQEATRLDYLHEVDAVTIVAEVGESLSLHPRSAGHGHP